MNAVRLAIRCRVQSLGLTWNALQALKDRYRGSRPRLRRPGDRRSKLLDRQLRWRAVNDKDIIVRVGLGVSASVSHSQNSLLATSDASRCQPAPDGD